ncbi:hypothetical protein EDD22DRAFT_850688 [Suillus occidentalis]|nr:hypothetical protein EDD22DRAFT_850688 [Suillus occidentalis]
MPGGRGSHRKGKVAVPEPTRGSGLDPSGLSAAGQLNIPTEQPQICPTPPKFVPKSTDTDDEDGDDEDDEDDDDEEGEDSHINRWWDSCFSTTTTWMPGGRGSHRKGRVAVPKPTRGSGLNPSGLPAASQLHIPTEQPQMSLYDFDPHGHTGINWQDAQQNAQNQYPQAQLPSMQASSSSLAGAYGSLPSMQASSLSLSGAQGLSQEREGAFGGMQASSSYAGAQGMLQEQEGVFGGTQASSSYVGAQGSSSYDAEPEYDFFDEFRDAFDPIPEPEGFAPIPRWIENAPDDGVSIMDRGDGLSPPASNLTLIRQGEISQADVVHTAGPARTMTTRTRRANLPPTPYIMPRVATDAHTVAEALPEASVDVDGDHNMPLGSQVTMKRIRLSADVINQTIKTAKVLVTCIVFTKNTMVCIQKKKQRLIDRVIEDSVPQFFGPNAVFESFITSTHRTKVLGALSAKRGKLIDFARFGVCDAYELFPPPGHVSTAGEYRTTKIDRFIHGPDPLLFMHDIVVDANNNINVRARFQNRFVMTNVIRFVWYWGNALYIEKSPLKALKHIHAVASTATHCALHEQGQHVLQIDPFGGTVHQAKFNQILNAFKHLTPAEKVEFDEFLQYVLLIGPSQARDNSNSSSVDSDD